jgi:hypothetical protein
MVLSGRNGAARETEENIMSTNAVYAAKTNDRLPGRASQMLVDACEANPDGKALASLDRSQNTSGGGLWYPVLEAWGHNDAVIVFVD